MGVGSDERKRRIGSGIPEKSSAGDRKGPRASLEVAVALALDGFLDAQQHRGEPLIQPRDGVEFLHLAPEQTWIRERAGMQRGWEGGVADMGSSWEYRGGKEKRKGRGGMKGQ